MRLLISATLAAALLASPALAEGWKRVSGTETHISYLDPSFTSRAGDQATVREMKVYEPSGEYDGTTYRARIVDYIFDCTTGRYRIMRVDSLDDAGGSKGVLTIGGDFRDASVAGSVGEDLYKASCGLIPLTTAAPQTRTQAIADGVYRLKQP
jgi:hypothetical protein